MPATSVPKNAPVRHDMSVILVTGSYDHEIRFWEAWSGICSRTIARTGESGVRSRVFETYILYSNKSFSKSTVLLSRTSKSAFVQWITVVNFYFSKRFLAAAIHKKIYLYDIASSSSDPVSIHSGLVFFI